VLAKQKFNGSIEEFGIDLSNHFIANNPQVSKAIIEIEEHLYERLSFENKTHPNAFIGAGNEKRITLVEQSAKDISITSGVKDLLILKTTDSGFEHYIKDRYTTLKETADRILATKCEVSWQYGTPQLNFNSLYTSIRNTLLKTFSFHKSLSVQQTLYAMAEAVLKEHEPVEQLSFVMPNKHHILFNLEQFGMDNKNEIFIATDEPFGYITGTVAREK
jgi:urate oxidase